MSKPKVTEWVSEWQGHLLSCSGQLKIGPLLFVWNSLQWNIDKRIKLFVCQDHNDDDDDEDDEDGDYGDVDEDDDGDASVFQ